MIFKTENIQGKNVNKDDDKTNLWIYIDTLVFDQHQIKSKPI